MYRRWLTPDHAPGTFVARCIFIPDDVDWLAIVAGALLPLTFPSSFERFGSATPEETAAEFTEMFDGFCFNSGVCRLIGEIVAFAGASNPNPTNWLDCDGGSYDRVAYTELFDVIGTTYGSVDSTHFNVPDLRGRTVIGVGQGPGLTNRSLGDSPGEETHTLILAEIAAHTHTDTGHSHSEITAISTVGAAITGVPIPSAIPSVGTTGVSAANLSTDGGDDPHNNIQPALALNYYVVAR